MTEGDIEVLERAILNEARAEAQRVLADAQAEADRINRRAYEDAGAEAEEILSSAREAVEIVRRQATATAQLEAQTLKLRRREEMLNRAFESARQRLPSLVEAPGYADLVRELLSEGVERLKVHADLLVVRADERTQRLLSGGLLSEAEAQFAIHLDLGPPLTGRTGLVVETAEGHRRYDNTLETRLGRMRDELRTPVYRLLTEGGA